MVSPAHYQGNDVVKEQPIEIMYRSMTQEAFEGYCIGNVMKYICRFRAKNGDEDLDKAKTYVPNGCAENLKAEGENYDAFIKSLGGIDLQLLGIGLDGHIGFNEPDAFFTKETHEVELDESTIEANARFFASKADVPTKAITMGMMSIMQAKKILLIANGAKKKDILDKAFFGPITPYVPASILQLHPDVTVIYSEN